MAENNSLYTKEKIAIPTQANTLYYTGEVQRPIFNTYDTNIILFTKTGEYFGTEAKIYNIVVTIESSKYVWADSLKRGLKNVSWEIKRKPLNIKPKLTGYKFYYNGKEQGPKISNYQEDTMVIKGVHKATNVGRYNMSIEPNSNYCWKYKKNGTAVISPVTLEWEIVPAVLQRQEVSNSTLIYNGKEQGPEYINDTSMRWSGTYKAVDAGKYRATVTPLTNYVWEDGTRRSYTFYWTIDPDIITKLPHAKKLNYTGKLQSPEWDNYDSEKYSIYGTTSAIYPGVYYVGFKPTDNYAWIDGTRTNKKVSWEIIEVTDSKTFNVADYVNSGGLSDYGRTTD